MVVRDGRQANDVCTESCAAFDRPLEEAEEVNRKVIELERESVNATQVSLTAAGLNDEGLRLEKSGDVEAAMAKYKAALDLDPTGYGFREIMGSLFAGSAVGRTVFYSCAKY